jgi:hypothetical protein
MALSVSTFHFLETVVIFNQAEASKYFENISCYPDRQGDQIGRIFAYWAIL